MATLENIIEIKTKDETFRAIKLEVPDIAGITDKLHLHILRLDRFERYILPLNKIESITGKPISAPKSEWKVKGSKGNEYTVTFTGGGYKCTCKGFIFNKEKPKTCSHIKEIIKI